MPKVIEPSTDTLGRSLDWLSTPESRAETSRQLDYEEYVAGLERQMAGDGIIYETSHGEWCRCWECRI